MASIAPAHARMTELLLLLLLMLLMLLLLSLLMIMMMMLLLSLLSWLCAMPYRYSSLGRLLELNLRAPQGMYGPHRHA